MTKTTVISDNKMFEEPKPKHMNIKLDRDDAVNLVSKLQQLIREEIENKNNPQWPTFEAEEKLIDFLAGELPKE